MGYVGYTLIVASVVWVIVAPPQWIHPYLPPFLVAAHSQPSAAVVEVPKSDKIVQEGNDDTKVQAPTIRVEDEAPKPAKAALDRVAMPPPPMIQRPSPQPSTPAPPPTIALPGEGTEEEEQTTPKAEAKKDVPPVPSFSLSPGDDLPASTPAAPTITPPAMALNPTPSASPSSSMMPPPPVPLIPRAAPPRANRRSPFLADSPQVARGPSLNPAPNRSPGASSLAPPPTHSQPPQKPSRKVLLTPGHSPLDWARISGPAADLRNLPPSTPYLKVTPSMLKRMTGRKGKDAWTALGGRVYNITPYIPYHPGGGPELLRCAGRDGNQLFGEVHPWVNYETMLSACLVGVLVPEDQAKTSEMDQMD